MRRSRTLYLHFGSHSFHIQLDCKALQNVRMVKHESYLADENVELLKVTLCRTPGCSTTACKNVGQLQDNQNFRKNRYCHFTTVDAGDMGKGVIANCAYTGEIITLEIYEQRVEEYLKAGTYYLDPFKIGNASKFVNHICSPNMNALRSKIDSMDRRFRAIGYFAVEFIKAGTPLTVNYQFDYDE